MKKLIVSILMAGLVMSSGTTQILAYTVNSSEESTKEVITEDIAVEEIALETSVNVQVANPNWRAYKFVDANNDGICDNCNDYNHQYFVDENGDRICDNLNNRHLFNDENKDGVCDDCNRANHGSKFVDSDSDGICDSFNETRLGYNFVDGNNDGVCDQMVLNQGKMNSNHHKGMRKGNRF